METNTAENLHPNGDATPVMDTNSPEPSGVQPDDPGQGGEPSLASVVESAMGDNVSWEEDGDSPSGDTNAPGAGEAQEVTPASQTPSLDGAAPAGDTQTAATDGDTAPEAVDADEWSAIEEEVFNDFTPEERAALKDRTKARISGLVQQRNQYKDALGQVRPFFEAMEQEGLQPQDVSTAIGLVSALNRGDFQTFLKAVSPYVQLAQQATGQMLPPDLAKQVEQGYITRNAAQELAARRMQGQTQQHQLRQMQQRQVQQQEAVRANAIRQTVTHWEANIRSRDPDYGRKAKLVEQNVAAKLYQLGRPATPEQAVQLAEQAYAEVNQYLGTLQPAPQPTRPQAPSSQGVNQGTPEPNSLMEAIQQGLRAAHA